MTYDQECREFVRVLTTTPLDSGQSLRQMTEFEDVCLWWFADFEMIKLLLSMPADNPVDYNPSGLDFQNKLCRLPLWSFGLLNFGFDSLRKLLLCGIQSLYEKDRLKIKHLNQPLILFNSEDLYWRTCHDYQTGESEHADVFFQPILKYGNKEEHLNFIATYPFVKYMYPLSEFSKAIKILRDRYKNGKTPYQSFNQCWNLKIAKKELDAGRLFRKRWKTIESDSILKRLCVLKEVDRFDLIRRQLQFFFYILFPYIVKRLELARSLLSKLKPDLLLLVNEYGHFERNLLIAAKERKIPVMAIQHGNITPSHQGYIYHKDDIDADGSAKFPYCPMPDVTAVWGDYFKRLLSETSAYRPETLIVTGNPGYDSLEHIRTHCTRQEVLQRYGIDTSQKVILWTTQSHGLTDDENEKNIAAVSRSASKLPDCTFIIKQHPNEPAQYTRLYETHGHSKHNNIVIVPAGANILELILACDIMMAKWSTTIIEAMVLDKDIVILNLGADKDRADYVRQSVAAGVYQAEYLTETIQKILDKSLNLADKRREYIQDYLYKVDGQSTKRISDVINKLLKK